MANIKSAKKRIKTISKKKVLNNVVKTSMKTAIKNVEKAVKAENKDLAKTNLDSAIKKIDKACSKGVVKDNTSNRYKSRIVKMVNSMK